MNGHRAPPTADIEQASAGVRRQTELVADQVVFGGLTFFQRGVCCDEAGARICHGLAEHQSVEVIADVVVMSDCRGIATERVPQAAQPRFLWRWRQGAAER